MKKIISCFSLFLLAGISLFAQVCISTNGSAPDASAMLDVSSTTRGMLPPRMTTAQRNAIASPAEGLVVYNTDEKALNVYTGTAWKSNQSVTEFVCGLTIKVNHLVTGGVAPVNKTVAYGTANGIPGETAKCWITSNLGANHQASAVDDATEASAGWYWQFNQKQGYKHDGTTRTPGTAWINNINEASDWLTANDPCALELSAGWRIPTYTELYNVDNTGIWTSWNGPYSSALKMHAAGYLNYTNGSLTFRGLNGKYWSSTQGGSLNGWFLFFSSGDSYMFNFRQANGFSVRCVSDN